MRPFAGVVKPQAAFFERAGPDGFRALQTIQHRARELGFITILDAKRGDIASTAAAYAEAAFSSEIWHADAITVNPYLGADAVEPFIVRARAVDGGVFVLVRTSNPGGGFFQNLVCDGKTLYRHVAEAVTEWNDNRGDVGAVIGATQHDELKELRAAMPGVWFLIPGYGARRSAQPTCGPLFLKLLSIVPAVSPSPFSPTTPIGKQKLKPRPVRQPATCGSEIPSVATVGFSRINDISPSELFDDRTANGTAASVHSQRQNAEAQEKAGHGERRSPRENSLQDQATQSVLDGSLADTEQDHGPHRCGEGTAQTEEEADAERPAQRKEGRLLSVQRLAEPRQPRRFRDALRQGRVRMHHAGNVLSTAVIFQDRHGFRDQV